MRNAYSAVNRTGRVREEREQADPQVQRVQEGGGLDRRVPGAPSERPGGHETRTSLSLSPVHSHTQTHVLPLGPTEPTETYICTVGSRTPEGLTDPRGFSTF